MVPDFIQMVEAMQNYINAPHIFTRQVLGVVPDDWQEEALQAIGSRSRVAIRSGHGVGKTALEAWICLWFLFTRLYPKIPCTAPTQRQLYDILWPEISKWMERSEILKALFDWRKTKVSSRVAPERWFATARTASKPENMAGFHEDHILFICDEASGIDDRIFETIEGALTTADAKLLLCGNPTRNSGVFKRAFFEDRDLYYTQKISCFDSGRVTDEYSQLLIRQYGMDSDVVRVRVLGEFPKAEPDGLIALEMVEAAMMRDSLNEDVKNGNAVTIGADIARFGDDETVIVPRIGGRVLEVNHYTKKDTMETAGNILQAAERMMAQYGKQRAVIYVDDDGVGGGVTDRLREVIYERKIRATVFDCHNGGAAADKAHYANFAAEGWCRLKALFQSGAIQLPQDDELAAQLSTRKYKVNSCGQIALEDKATYKKRTRRSPDRADALVLAFTENSVDWSGLMS